MLKRLLYCLPTLVCLTVAFGQHPPETKLPQASPSPERPALESMPNRIPASNVERPTKPPVAIAPCDCCAKKPTYDSPAWAPFTGQIAIITQMHNFDPTPAPSDRVVIIWNLNGEPPALVNKEWGTAASPATQYYSDSSWSSHNMGEVFGLTLDNQGNIFVASTAVYGSGTGSGQIYKIANGSGVPTPFKMLPVHNHSGLGNITYDCKHDSFYVSNFTDGLIYQLDHSSGNVLSTFDAGANLSIAGTDSLGFAKLGRRAWAVATLKDTLYFSIWNQDMNHHPGVGPNQIWSVALSSTGAPILSTMHLEITMSALTGYPFSSPVSDIRFTAMEPCWSPSAV